VNKGQKVWCVLMVNGTPCYGVLPGKIVERPYKDHGDDRLVVEVPNHKPESGLGENVQRTVNGNRAFTDKKSALALAVMENQRAIQSYQDQIAKLMEELVK
jgi:hypothetical protein